MEQYIEGSVLLVGEGDFSFSVSLVDRLCSECGRSCHVTATSIETEETILKHKLATEHIQTLKSCGVDVHLNIDATQLHLNETFAEKTFDRIIFNFPHAGGKSNHKKNRKLLNDFFASAVQMLSADGQIFVTLCKGQGGTEADKPRRAWHDSWQVVSMATNAGLILTAVRPFDINNYRVYSSTGFRSLDKGFHTENALTHVFEKARVVDVPEMLENHYVKIQGSIYTCRRHIKQKLLAVRHINENLHHPVHAVYTSLKSLWDRLLSKSQYSLSNLGLVSPFVSTTNTTNYGPMTTENTMAHYKVQKASLETEIDSEVCFDDLVNRCCDLKSCDDLNLMNTEEFMCQAKDSGLSIFYGPVFRPCRIAEGKSAVTYQMGLGCSKDESDDSDDGYLEKFENTLYRFIQRLSKLDRKVDEGGQSNTSKEEIKVNVQTYFKKPIHWNGLALKSIGGVNLIKGHSFSNRNMNKKVYEAEQSNPAGESVETEIGEVFIIRLETSDFANIKLNENSNVKSEISVKVVFSIDLFKLLEVLFDIEDGRILWSRDERVLAKLGKLNNEILKTLPPELEDLPDLEDSVKVEASGKSEIMENEIRVVANEILLGNEIEGEKDELGSDKDENCDKTNKSHENLTNEDYMHELTADRAKQATKVQTIITDGKITNEASKLTVDDVLKSNATEPLNTESLKSSQTIKSSVESCVKPVRSLDKSCVKPVSLYPMKFVHDMSFWENETVPFDETLYHAVIRDIADDEVISVELIDTYVDSSIGRTSRCYRLTFQSVDKALSYDTSWKLQSLIRLEVQKQMQIVLR